MKYHQFLRILLGTIVLLGCYSAPLANAQCCGAEPTTFTQPDGTEIEVHFHGNERYTRTTTSDGYTLTFDSETKAYYYAELNDAGDEFLSTGVLAQQQKPADLDVPRNLALNPEVVKELTQIRSAELEAERQEKRKWEEQKRVMSAYRSFQKNQKRDQDSDENGDSLAYAPPVNPPTLGNLLGLTILVDFSDTPARSDVTSADLDDMLNKPGGRVGWGNKGSVYDYYYAQSNGRLRFNNNVTYYVRVPNPYSYYNNTSINGRDNGAAQIFFCKSG